MPLFPSHKARCCRPVPSYGSVRTVRMCVCVIHLCSKGRQAAVYCCGWMQTVLKISLLFWCLGFVLPSSKLTFFSALSVSMHPSGTQIKLTTNPNKRASLTCVRSVLNCCSSIIETKGTEGRCGGAWAQLCSAFCLTGGSLPEEAERDGGEGTVGGSPPLPP